MKDVSVRQLLLECFRAVFPGIKDEDLASLSAETNPGWDSVTQVTLISVIEEEFGITLPEERYGELTSFQSLFAYLDSLHAKA